MTITVRSGLAPVRRVLSNGAVVLTKQSPTLPAVTIQASIDAGSARDPRGQEGLAHFVSRMLDRGTETLSADAIADEVDGRGASLTVGLTRHLMTVTCNCLVRDLQPMLRLVGEILRRPTFPVPEMEARRGEIATAIHQDEDNPAVMAVERLMGLLYPDAHPYGRPAKGTGASLAGMDRAALLAFHRAHFTPLALSVVLVGDLEPARMLDLSADAFEAWPATPPVPLSIPPAAPAVGRRHVVVPMMNKAQADIAYGFTTIRRADPAYYAYFVMNNALGQYGIGGRLGDRIREREGMAYYVFSSFDASVAEGPLSIRAGVAPENVDRAVASIDEELTVLASRGLSDREFEESRDYLIGSMPRTLETNEGIAQFLQAAEFFGLGLDFDLRLPDLLRAVTLEQVNEAARRALDPARATLVIAGPYGPSA